jgi:hypothetical protein
MPGALLAGMVAAPGYYEEAREVVIIPEGHRSQAGSLIGVGPGLCRLVDMKFAELHYETV